MANSADAPKVRIEYLDIAKAIGILCIIAGHMGMPKVDRVVFTFHVPLFFLISGYFLNNTERMDCFVIKKARSLLIPYYFTGICLILIKIPINIIKGAADQIPKDVFHTLLQVLYASGTNTNHTIAGIRAIGAIWFLFALFWAEIIVRISLDKVRGGVLIIAAVTGYYTSRYVWLPFNLQAGAVSAIFVYLGALCKKKKVSEKSDWKIILAGFIALLLEVYFGIALYCVSNTYDHGIVSMIGAVLISGSVIEISKYIGKCRFLKKVLLFYGKNSMIILCWHLIELNNIPWDSLFSKMRILSEEPLLQSVLVFWAKLLFVTVCTYITLKVEFLKKIFGKK